MRTRILLGLVWLALACLPSFGQNSPAHFLLLTNMTSYLLPTPNTLSYGYLDGKTTRGDQFGGWFYAISGSVAAIDGTNVFGITNGLGQSGRWIRGELRNTGTNGPVGPVGGVDVTGTLPNNLTVIQINGASVPVAGALTAGNGLYVTGTSTLAYSALNIGGGANYVTGTLPPGNGGTGLASYTIGDIIVATGSTTLAALADVATGNALISGGIGAAPSWGKIGLTTHVTGTLGVGNGGSGAPTFTAGVLESPGGTGAFTTAQGTQYGIAYWPTPTTISSGLAAVGTNTFLRGNPTGSPDFERVNVSNADIVGTLAATNFPALTGPLTTVAGSLATTLTNSIAAGGPVGSATVAPIITYNANGMLTAVSSATITPAASSITGAANLSVGAGVSISSGTGTGATLQAVTVAVDQGFSPTWTGSHTFDTATTLRSTDIYSTPPSQSFKGDFKYNAAAAYSTLAQLTMGKENATDGNTAGYLSLSTRTNTGNNLERFHITSSGGAVFYGGNVGNSISDVARTDAVAEFQHNEGGHALVSIYNTQTGVSAGVAGQEESSLALSLKDAGGTKGEVFSMSSVWSDAAAGVAYPSIRFSTLWNSGANQERDFQIFGGHGIYAWAANDLTSTAPGYHVFKIGGKLHVYDAADANYGQAKIEASSGNWAGLSFYTPSSDSANTRNWAFQNNYSVRGNFELLRSTTQTGAPTTTVATWDSSGNMVSVGAFSSIALTNTSLTTGRLLFSTNNGTIIDDTNLYWDNSNKRLSLGAGTSPTAQFVDTKNQVASNVGDSTLFRINNAQGAGNRVEMTLGGSANNMWMGMMDSASSSTNRFYVSVGSTTESLDVYGNGNVAVPNGNFSVSGTSLLTGAVTASTSITDSGLTATQVVYADTAGLLAGDSLFVWDKTNHRLGLGVTPSQQFSDRKDEAAPNIGDAHLFRLDNQQGSGNRVEMVLGGSQNNAWFGMLDNATNTVNRLYWAVGTATEKLQVFGDGSVKVPAGNFSVSGTSTLTGAVTASTSITDSGLTAGRVTFAGTSGLLSDDSDLTFSTDTLTATKLIAPTSVTTPVVIGGSAVGSALELRSTSATGTTDNIKFTVGTNGGTEAMRIVHSGAVSVADTVNSLVGTDPFGVKGNFDVYSDSQTIFRNYSASATASNAGRTVFGRARGTIASPTIVSSGDLTGWFQSVGYDGAAYNDVAGIKFEVDGTPGLNDMPGRIIFLTDPDGSNTAIERMRIDNAGNVSIATAGAKLTVNGGASFGATVDPGTGVVNANTGFRVANAAANNTFLKASGGNYVGAAIVATNLPDTAVTPGTYTNSTITVDQQGRLTAASNGSTGITPANLSVGSGVAITAGTGTGATLQALTLAIDPAANITWTGSEKFTTATTMNSLAITNSAHFDNVTGSRAAVFDPSNYLTNSPTTATEIGYVSGVTSAIQTQLNAKGIGSVTSVAMTAPSFINIAGTPITTSGTLALTFASQDANTALLGPTTGAAAAPTFRGFVTADVAGVAVTSVGLSMPSIITVSGSPVTTTGTLTGTLATQTANTVFAGPTSGGAATPAFRAINVADFPYGAGYQGLLYRTNQTNLSVATTDAVIVSDTAGASSIDFTLPTTGIPHGKTYTVKRVGGDTVVLKDDLGNTLSTMNQANHVETWIFNLGSTTNWIQLHVTPGT